jgi:hypothetical protein
VESDLGDTFHFVSVAELEAGTVCDTLVTACGLEIEPESAIAVPCDVCQAQLSSPFVLVRDRCARHRVSRNGGT